MAALKIAFIDRDGVINVDPIGSYITRWEDFRFEKGVLETLQKIQALGYELIIISNQAGIGDGVYPESALWEIHKNMLKEFEKAGIRIRSSHFCSHGKEAGCKCRKPEIGLFQEAVKGLNFDKTKSFFIGDKATDVEAGKRFGVKTIFVRTGHGRFDEPLLKGSRVPDFRINQISEVVAILSS